jgi:hypothetical protein
MDFKAIMDITFAKRAKFMNEIHSGETEFLLSPLK